MIKYVDTFSGLGGFSLAIREVLGKDKCKCVKAIDFDKNVAETFKNNFFMESLGNIRDIPSESVPDHEIIFGGFPCQPFSRNGKWFNKNDKTIGDDEDRDNLFLELVRILKHKNPKYFLFENVTGLLSMKNKDGSSCVDTIVANLTDCGYKVHYKVLNASDYGVPQQRKRVFFLGIRNDIKDDFQWPKPIKLNLAIEDILQADAPEKYLISNLWKNRSINVLRQDKKNHPFNKGHSRYETVKWIYENSQKPKGKTGRIESVAILYGDTPSGLPRQQDKVYSIKGISPTIATFSTPVVDSAQGFRQLTPRECARLQGFPEDYKFPSSDAAAYKQIGNSVAIPVIVSILRSLLK